jgi:hypothetical protein
VPNRGLVSSNFGKYSIAQKMVDTMLAYDMISKMLDEASIKYEAQTFPSGAIMLDIWHRDRFYVLQFKDKLLGWSEITDENPGFDTIPDNKFYDANAFVDSIALLLATGAETQPTQW